MSFTFADQVSLAMSVMWAVLHTSCDLSKLIRHVEQVRGTRRRHTQRVAVNPQDQVPLGQDMHHVVFAGWQRIITASETQDGLSFEHDIIHAFI